MTDNFVVTGIDRVIMVGKDEYPEKKLTFFNELTRNELILHLSGKSVVHFNGKVLECNPNTIRFLPKGENKEYVVLKEECGDCIDIFFSTDKEISSEAFTLNLKDNTNAEALFKKIFSVWVAKNEGYYFECMSLLYKIFAEIKKENYIPQKQYTIIKPAIEYVEENFLREKISVPYLANLCSVSESYLKKLFIKKFGVSPVKYIINLKINHACDLLREGYGVSSAAEICGYANLYFFSRQFKEYVGVSPTEFKEKYKSSK